MAGSDEDPGRSRRPGVKDRGWSHSQVLDSQTIGRSGDTVHVETRSESFLVEPQNQGGRFVSGLASKPLGRFSPVCPQNRWRRFLPVWPQNQWLWVSQFGPQNKQIWFGDLGLKITATVSWFVPQNQVGDGLSVAPQNRFEDAMSWDTHRNLVACFMWK
jgi:hypothetical protein